MAKVNYADKKETVSVSIKNNLRGEIAKLYDEGNSLRQVRDVLRGSYASLSDEDFEELTRESMDRLVRKTYNGSADLMQKTVALNGSVYLKCTDALRTFYISSSDSGILFEDDFLELKNSLGNTYLGIKRIDPFSPRFSLKSMDTLSKLDSFYRRYIYFEDESSYALLSSYTIMTYCFELFNSLPYLKLSGSKGAGKTTVMKCMLELVNRGSMTSSITPSSLVRMVDKEKPTLFLDEAEKLTTRNNGNNDLLLAMNSGYERNGSVTKSVKITKGDTSEFVPTRFSVFCPKIIAAINPLAPATEDRCIVVELKAAPEKAGLSSYIADDQALKEEIGTLKDMLNLTALKISGDLANYIKNPELLELDSSLKNRHLDRWLPILSIAKLLSFSVNYFERLKELCMKDITAKQIADESLPETQCRKIICDYVKDNLEKVVAKTADHYELDANDLFKVIKANDIYNTYSDRGQLTRVLKKLKIESLRKRVKTELTTLYCIPVSLLA